MNIEFEDAVRRMVSEYGLGVLDDPVQCREILLDMVEHPEYYPKMWLDISADEYKAELGQFMRMIDNDFHKLLARSRNSEQTVAFLKQILQTDYQVIPTAAENAVHFLALLLGKAKPVFTVCLTCGEPLRIGWKVCPYCGTELQEMAVLPPPPPPPVGIPSIEEFQSKLPPAGFVRIPAGTFLMGSPVYEDGRGIDEGQHRVTVRSFFMGKYEVTQEEYQELMGTNPSHFRGFNLPVEQVSWYDAVEYCNRRSERDKLKPAYTKSRGSADCDWQANGYRLPTEAEWEYACRAGTASPYYTGCFVDKAGWYNKNSGGITHPVGQKEPNSWGLYDMHGNIWEWCWDWYGEYDLHPQTNPVGPAQGDTRVARGGSWDYGGGNVRSAVRYGKRFSLVNKGNSLGFRLVRSL